MCFNTGSVSIGGAAEVFFRRIVLKWNLSKRKTLPMAAFLLFLRVWLETGQILINLLLVAILF